MCVVRFICLTLFLYVLCLCSHHAQSYVDEYDRDWYLGVEGSVEWNAICAEASRKLFSIQKTSERGRYSSLTLERTILPFHYVSLLSTPIHSIWSSLIVELFYFANDDDERYSIQAHEFLLRNLMVQSSEPPFGYPVYNSKAMTIKQ